MALAVEDVRAIIATVLTDAQIAALMADAELIAGACLTAITDEARRDAILKYLTADLIASTVATNGKGVLTSKKLGDASESYGTSSGGAIQGAQFGRSAYWSRAMALDPYGCLARLGGKTATFERV